MCIQTRLAPKSSFYVRKDMLNSVFVSPAASGSKTGIVELQWLEHLWNHENISETEVVQANEC